MASARDVARHLVHLADGDAEGEAMTSLRLHKLLYYCQGWHMAWAGRPLFADRIEAWRYGPVIPAVYSEPWGQGPNPIQASAVGPAEKLTDEDRAYVEQVWRHYCRYSACGLRDLTHAERPWMDHYKPDAHNRCSKEIPAEELAAFFGEQFRHKTGDEIGSANDAGRGRVLTTDQLRQELGW